MQAKFKELQLAQMGMNPSHFTFLRLHCSLKIGQTKKVGKST
jgi:hypothetical protein